jgi:hypothetical protein
MPFLKKSGLRRPEKKKREAKFQHNLKKHEMKKQKSLLIFAKQKKN